MISGEMYVLVMISGYCHMSVAYNNKYTVLESNTNARLQSA